MLSRRFVTWLGSAAPAALLLAGCATGDAGSAVSGHVADSAGAAMPGVRVTLDGPSGRGGNRATRLAAVRTDSAGCFRVFGLHAPGEGTIRLIADLPGFQPVTLTAAAPGQFVADITLGSGVAADTSYGSLAAAVLADSVSRQCGR